MKDQFLKALLCPCNVGLLAKLFPAFFPLLGIGAGSIEAFETVGHAAMAIGILLPCVQIYHLRMHGEHARSARRRAWTQIAVMTLIIAAHVVLLHRHDGHGHTTPHHEGSRRGPRFPYDTIMRMNASPDRFRDLLRRAGYRATAGRIGILETLERAAAPLSIPEIRKSPAARSVDQATVYRILHKLEEKGAVRQVDLRHGHAHFELAGGADHHHLVCTSCGRTEDFVGCGAATLVRAALKQSRHFREVADHAIELFGICRSCGSDGKRPALRRKSA